MTVAKHSEVEVISQTESRSRRIVDLLGGDDETPRDGFHCRKPFSPRHVEQTSKKLFRLSDASGQLSFGLVKEAERISNGDFQSDDVFLLDDGGKAIWVWQGSGSSAAEKKSWFKVAQAYVRHLSAESGRDDAYLTPVAKVVEGGESRAFARALAA
ncbi:hypothetical protein NXS19_013210 [Fusarium pseudograminearum]|nr:hypothetical protein NXS19_013210 [Fusarium pseudograminearum]